MPLSPLAHAQSDDQGDTAKLGLIAREERYCQILIRKATAERFELPNLQPGWMMDELIYPLGSIEPTFSNLRRIC